MSRRLLVVDARIPTPDRETGSLRLVRILESFRRLDFEVTLVPSFPDSFAPFDATLSHDAARLRARGIEVPPRAEREPADRYLERHGSTFDLALLSGIFVAARHYGTLRRAAPSLPIVFDTIDLHFLREYRHAQLTRNAPRLAHALKLKRLEFEMAAAADATLVVSEREADILRREAPLVRPWVVDLAVDLAPEVAPLSPRRDLLYLGAFTFSPNADAVAWFVHEVLPGLRRRCPGISVSVVGSDPTDEVRALAAADVQICGFVPDLKPVFAAHRVFVAPLRYGAGVKGKVQLALAHGLPSVLSRIAAEGLPIAAGREALIADDPASWVEQIARLYSDQELWHRLSTNGRELVAEHYSPARLESRLRALVAEVGRTAR